MRFLIKTLEMVLKCIVSVFFFLLLVGSFLFFVDTYFSRDAYDISFHFLGLPLPKGTLIEKFEDYGFPDISITVLATVPVQERDLFFQTCINHTKTIQEKIHIDEGFIDGETEVLSFWDDNGVCRNKQPNVIMSRGVSKRYVDGLYYTISFTKETGRFVIQISEL